MTVKVRNYLDKKWLELCKNALWFRDDSEKAIHQGLGSALLNLFDAKLITRWSIVLFHAEHNIELRDNNLEEAYLYARAILDLDIDEVKNNRIILERTLQEQRLSGLQRRRPSNRWNMIAEELQLELPLNTKKHQQKNGTDSRFDESGVYMSDELPLEK